MQELSNEAQEEAKRLLTHCIPEVLQVGTPAGQLLLAMQQPGSAQIQLPRPQPLPLPTGLLGVLVWGRGGAVTMELRTGPVSLQGRGNTQGFFAHSLCKGLRHVFHVVV